jgi:hypothetical protein
VKPFPEGKYKINWDVAVSGFIALRHIVQDHKGHASDGSKKFNKNEKSRIGCRGCFQAVGFSKDLNFQHIILE